MATNQNEIALKACRDTVNYVNAILAALDGLEVVGEKLTGAAIDLADFVALIEATAEIQHCDAATLKNILTAFAPEIVTHLKAFYSGTPTQQGWAALMKARR